MVTVFAHLILKIDFIQALTISTYNILSKKIITEFFQRGLIITGHSNSSTASFRGLCKSQFVFYMDALKSAKPNIYSFLAKLPTSVIKVNTICRLETPHTSHHSTPVSFMSLLNDTL